MKNFILLLRDGAKQCFTHEKYRIKNDQRELYTLEMNKVIEQATNGHNNLHYIKMRDITCDQNGCKLFDNNNYPIFSDNNHLPIWGRDLIAPVILERLRIGKTQID